MIACIVTRYVTSSLGRRLVYLLVFRIMVLEGLRSIIIDGYNLEHANARTDLLYMTLEAVV